MSRHVLVPVAASSSSPPRPPPPSEGADARAARRARRGERRPSPEPRRPRRRADRPLGREHLGRAAREAPAESARRFFGAPGDRGRRSESLGSGVILDASGIVVTNDHVISGASKIYVTTSDGRELEAELLGADADNDLAVLKVDGEGAEAGAPRDDVRPDDRRDGDRRREPVRPLEHRHDRHRLRPPADREGRGAHLHRLHPDRRRDQPRELGRGALQRPRRADRDQHGDRRRREHDRLRDPGRAGPPDRRRPPPLRRGQAGLDRRERDDRSRPTAPARAPAASGCAFARSIPPLPPRRPGWSRATSSSR